MQIVTDRGMDLTPDQMKDLSIHFIPLTFTLDGKSYRSGVDIQPEEFYRLLESTSSMPTTTQPSPGEFAELYRKIAKEDPEILSIHISSGLSGTFNTARLGAELVPEARVDVIDTKTLSGAEGWQVQAAALAARAGWSKPRIIDLLQKISDVSDTIFTLKTLKYLIHGGRISHIKGLLATMLNIKPLIGVEKVHGVYVQKGQEFTLNSAIAKISETISHQYLPGSNLRAQIFHGNNPAGAALLKEKMDALFNCAWLPTGVIAPVLGAHTGPGLVGVVFALAANFPALP
jgi:DegV family protein with EDD domain